MEGDAMTSIEARLMAAALGELKSDVVDLRTSIRGMQTAVEALIRMDEQQANQRAAIGRAFDDLKVERQRREALDERVRLLEVDAPSQRELRRWVIGGILTGSAALLAALCMIVFKVVISDPVDRNFRSTAPSPAIQQSFTSP